ncbi:unnamed protein product [Effrenium voratum]|uniref:Uncharacterized protein n=1 Tax=Effrenium voratum TaxID=2562239 RepID=A0AA36I891_9DINO|nr:unnamed protein product [Effrenium voratum]CAJ1381925.1 unnamed protein product [Effrenium voratum]CAJ1436437.1 unnamed protein product [Effrenium voratum]
MGEGPCWLCEGRDSSACVICGPERPVEEGASLLGQDGWCCQEDSEARFGGWTKTTTEDLYWELLLETEALLRSDSNLALERAERCARNLEQLSSDQVAQLRCLAYAQLARCHLARQEYTLLVEDCKRYARLREEAEGSLLEKFEAEVAPLGPLATLGAAAELATSCRAAVTDGFAPKVVLDHASRALSGVQLLPLSAFPGLPALRAHLYASRCQACLELEKWREAKQDATSALQCDPDMKEAKYLLRAAESESW